MGTLAFHGLEKSEGLRFDLSEYDVLAIEPLGLGEAHEELRAVGVGASVGHREDTHAVVLLLEVFVCELGAVDGFSASAVASCEIAALAHEAGNDAVEAAAFETEALFTSAESAEVLGGLGGLVEEIHGDASCILAIDLDVEKDCSVNHSYI